MKLAISNIAWNESQDLTIASRLKAAGAEALEVAPGRIRGQGDAAAVRRYWESSGLPIVSMQSLLFSVSGAALFGSESEKQVLVETLSEVIGFADALNCSALVFGSPKNRRKGDMSLSRAIDAAVPVFQHLGDLAAAFECSFCVEANAEAYGCDFVTRLAEAEMLIDAVDHPNVNLMIDTGNMEMAGDDVRDARRIASRVRHCHISRPYLAPVDEDAQFARRIVDALRQSDYSGIMTIEMKAGESDGADAACRAVETVRTWLDG